MEHASKTASIIGIQRTPQVARVAAAVATAAALTVGMAGVAVGSARQPTTSGAHRAATALGHKGAKGTVTVTDAKRGKLGLILVDGAGRTLYHYALDRHDHSACTGSCAALWPPLLLAPADHHPIGRGVNHLGTILRSGRNQVTYNGEPLYTYRGDHRAGETNGQGFGGVWHVVTVSAARHTTTTTTHSGGGAYGY